MTVVRGRVGALLLGALALASCQGSHRAGPAEPRLTNPIRLDAFLGPETPVGSSPYGQVLRLPLRTEWTAELPDDGRWALVRMELSEPTVQQDAVVVGSSRASGLLVLERATGRVLRRVATEGPVQAPVVVLTPTEDAPVEGGAGAAEADRADAAGSGPPSAGAGGEGAGVRGAGGEGAGGEGAGGEGAGGGGAGGESAGGPTAGRSAARGGYLAADTFGVVTRFDADWKPLWAAPYRAGAGVTRAPVLDGDQVLVATTGDQIVAIGLADGAFRWSYRREVARTSMELAIAGAPAPVVDGDAVLAGFSDGAVVGLDRATGRLLWEVQVGRGQFPDVEAEVVVEDGIVVAAAFGGPLVGFDRATRRVLYRIEDGGATASMDHDAGTVYAADGKGRVRAIDVRTGAIAWTWERAGKLFGGPRKAGGLVLVGDVEGTLYAVDRFDGTLRAIVRPDDGTRLAGIAARPVVAGRQVFVPTAGGRLWAFVGDSGLDADHSEEPGHRRDRPLGW